MKTKSTILILVLLALSGLGFYLFTNKSAEPAATRIQSYEDCIEAGYSIMESNPPQCATQDGTSFTKKAGDALEVIDNVTVSAPRSNGVVGSNFRVNGEAHGSWFFEGDFPVRVETASGEVLAETFASAEGEWMNEESVPYSAQVSIETDYVGVANLILSRANPSGLPENDTEIIVPITIEQEISKNDEKKPGDKKKLAECFAGGCSGQICSDDPGAISTCEWRQEYECYALASCERQASGECAWTPNYEFEQCLNSDANTF